jgi:hypothetical protein
MHVKQLRNAKFPQEQYLFVIKEELFPSGTNDVASHLNETINVRDIFQL